MLLLLQIGLDETCTVDDITSPDHVYDGVTALHLAAIGGKLAMVKSVIKAGAFVNGVTSVGTGALHAACFEGNCAIVETLVAAGAHVNAVDVHGATCLMAAATSDDVNLLAYLIRHGADVNAVDEDGRSVLFYVLRDATIDSFVYVSSYRTVACVDARGANVLMWAAELQRVEVLAYILGHLDSLRITLDDCDEHGRNVLFYLRDHTSSAIWDLLVETGVRMCADADGVTPLMHCASRGDHLAKHIIKQSTPPCIDINERDTEGRNCLFYCTETTMLEFFLSNGARPEPCGVGRTLLMHAAKTGNVHIAKHLLENSYKCETNVNATDNTGWDASMHAVACGHLNLLKLLISNGSQRRQADDGTSVVTLAAESGDIPMLIYLMEDVQASTIAGDECDSRGRNALHYAVVGMFTMSLYLLINQPIIAFFFRNTIYYVSHYTVFSTIRSSTITL